MLVGIKNNVVSPKYFTAKDYIKNGLILHVDGIENDGYGKHSSQSITELITNTTFQSISGYDSFLIGKNSIDLLSSKSAMQINFTLSSYLNFTVELVSTLAWESGDTSYFVFHTTPGTSWTSQMLGWRYVSAESCFISSHGSQYGLNWYYDIHRAGVREGTVSYNTYSGLRLSEGGRISGMSQSSFSKFRIGCSGNSSFSDKSPTGKIYAIRFYNRPLSLDELTYNYSVDKLRFGLT